MSNKCLEKEELRRIFSTIAPVYDFLNRLFSLREDMRWRRFAARSLSLVSPTPLVLDVATGSGDLAFAIAKRPERPHVVGLDLVPTMLSLAQAKSIRYKTSISLLAGNALELPFTDELFDAVTIAFGIRNIFYRIQAMKEMRRVLKSGSRLYVLEFAVPQLRWIRSIYICYLTYLLPYLGRIISGDRASYQYLADSIMKFPLPLDFKAELEAAGFVAPRSYSLTGGIVQLYVAEKSF